jgi:hypothetical protein
MALNAVLQSLDLLDAATVTGQDVAEALRAADVPDESDEFKEFTIPLETARGQKFTLSGKMRTRLDDRTKDEIAHLLAQALVAHYQKTLARWEPVRRRLAFSMTGDSAAAKSSTSPQAPKVRAQVGSVGGRRVFTMACAEWDRLRAHEGTLVEIDLERVPTGGVAESASMIACLAAEYLVHTARIEVWRYSEKDQPTPYNVQEYLVLENLTRRVNLPMFAGRASTQDSPNLRKHLREHVFIVKEQPDKGRWQAKARVLERIVFMATGSDEAGRRFDIALARCAR